MAITTLLTIKDALARSATWLTGRGIASGARLDSELLLAETLGLTRLDLYLYWDRPLDEREKERYRELLQRRASFEPVAYILGRREFFSLSFRVTPAVLVPRPETEGLVELALELLKERASRLGADAPAPCVADVGTGSGAIAVAVAAHCPEARLVATDVSPAALEVARENAATHGVAERVTFHETSLLDAVAGPLDLVLSNPPYIRDGDFASLPPDVTRHEPHGALFAGPDGLDVIRRLVPAAGERLAPGGWLALEVGHDQAAAVRQLLASDGRFEPAVARRDLQGIERVVHARRAAV
jgi:release factor glutamine methyltransferase